MSTLLVICIAILFCSVPLVLIGIGCALIWGEGELGGIALIFFGIVAGIIIIAGPMADILTNYI